jgi:hypothetical protein
MLPAQPTTTGQCHVVVTTTHRRTPTAHMPAHQQGRAAAEQINQTHPRWQVSGGECR